jgi:hypothetical protein
MAFLKSSIDDYRSKVFGQLGGLQRTNRFEVFINHDAIGRLEMPAVNVSLPGRSLEGVLDDLTAQGSNPRAVPIRRGYGGEPSVLMQFYMDQNWSVREYFESWFDLYSLITDDGGSDMTKTGNYIDLIEADVEIYFMDLKEDGRHRWKMSLREAYPTSIIQGQASSGSFNEIMTMDISLGFKEYKTSSVPQPTG